MAKKEKKDKEEKEEGSTEEESGGGGKKKLIFIIVGALILIGGAAGGAMMFMGGDEPAVAEGEEAVEEEEPKDIAYLPFSKPVVINYQTDKGKTYFLKTEITLMTEEEDRLEDIKKHLPKIQHTVNVAFSRQKFEDIRTAEGKENMRIAALEEVQKVLTEEMGEKNVDDLLYTTFVTQ